MSERTPVPRYVFPLLFTAVGVWGLLIAVGAFLRDWDWRKPALVLACVAAFLGLWAGVLALVRRRRSTNNTPS